LSKTHTGQNADKGQADRGLTKNRPKKIGSVIWGREHTSSEAVAGDQKRPLSMEGG